jgi:hypothetical protein
MSLCEVEGTRSLFDEAGQPSLEAASTLPAVEEGVLCVAWLQNARNSSDNLLNAFVQQCSLAVDRFDGIIIGFSHNPRLEDLGDREIFEGLASSFASASMALEAMLSLSRDVEFFNLTRGDDIGRIEFSAIIINGDKDPIVALELVDGRPIIACDRDLVAALDVSVRSDKAPTDIIVPIDCPPRR